MSIKLEQNFQQSKSALSLVDGKVPVSILIKPGSPGVIQFSDSTQSNSICIGCLDQPCINYSDNDRDSSLMGMFKLDQNSNVCGVNAITWSEVNNQPTINEDLCIACGVCASRCPTKSIYLDANTAKISNVSSFDYRLATEDLHLKSKNQFLNSQLSGVYFEESDQFISHFVERMKSIGGKGGSINPNLLVRNLLRSLGIPAEAYAQGVQYNAVDVVFRAGNLIGAGEVELSNAAIDVPRNLAGIVAFLVSRNKIDKNKITTFSFVSRLPQGREQYWMVIDDMKSILDIEIHTLSISSMCLLVWSRATLDLPNPKLLLSQKNQNSLRPFIESLIKRKIKVSDGLENQFEPSKLIE